MNDSDGADRLPSLTLILGGTRSGKSCVARRRAEQSGRRVVFVATAEPEDEAMRRRIRRHRRARPEDWETLEPPVDPRRVARRLGDREDGLVLLDDLSLIVARWVHREEREGPAVLEHVDEWLDVLRGGRTPWIVVSALVGRGVVPRSRGGRRFRDVLGDVNRRLAAGADRVTEVVAGLSRTLKAGAKRASPDEKVQDREEGRGRG